MGYTGSEIRFEYRGGKRKVGEGFTRLRNAKTFAVYIRHFNYS
jgi:hypothetical protein